MKKNLVRILALALVLILALGIIPLGAFADGGETSAPSISIPDFTASLVTYYYNKYPLLSDIIHGGTAVDHIGDPAYPAAGTTIKSSSYDQYVVLDGNRYDFAGFFTDANNNLSALYKKMDEYYNSLWADSANLNQTPEGDLELNSEALSKLSAYEHSLFSSVAASFSKSNIKVEAFPTLPDTTNMTDEQAAKAMEAYYNATDDWYQKYSWIIAGYVPHSHSLSRWYSDGTTHWRECLVCKDNFMYQNWCQDGDGDEVCNVCGGHVPYHDITVIESEGGKITVNLDTASHRTKITADVETNEGYQFVKLHFTKVREDGSRQEVVRYEKGGQFWTLMPTYDMEVSAEFVKK